MTVFETQLNADMAEAYRRAGFWRDDTFHDILTRRAAEHPDREVLYDRRARITYKELANRVDAVAAVLQAHGIGRHDVVTIQLPNWIEFACAFFCHRTSRRHRHPGKHRFPRARTQLHPEIFAKRRLYLSAEFPRLRSYGDDRKSASRFAVVARGSVHRSGGSRRYRVALRCSAGQHFGCRTGAGGDGGQRGLSDGLHVRHDRQPQGGIPQPQHDIVGMPDPERRSRYSCRRCLPPLPAARSQLGISGVAADRHRRSPGGTVGQIFRR